MSALWQTETFGRYKIEYRSATAAPSPLASRPPARQTPCMWTCYVDGCDEAVACELCERCAKHCSGPAPNDFEGHRAQMTVTFASADHGAIVFPELPGERTERGSG